jgi:hypothetical protein
MRLATTRPAVGRADADLKDRRTLDAPCLQGIEQQLFLLDPPIVRVRPALR